jgi:hypothetical protein
MMAEQMVVLMVDCSAQKRADLWAASKVGRKERSLAVLTVARWVAQSA